MVAFGRLDEGAEMVFAYITEILAGFPNLLSSSPDFQCLI